MKPIPIPIVPFTQSSAAGDAAPDVFALPREVTTFTMPAVPRQASARDLAGARELLLDLAGRMNELPMTPIDLAGLDAGVVGVLNDTLREGEVSIRIDPSERRDLAIAIQETVFAGIWRERHVDATGTIVRDLLCAAPIPAAALDAARDAAASALVDTTPLPGLMNAPALFAEIAHQVGQFRAGQPAYVINLTLLPVSREDLAMLHRAVPPGPVTILSRGFGNCRVASTRVAKVWRVQYFGSTGAISLDTFEVVDVPEVACAADEDLRESRERLLELIEWIGESIDAAPDAAAR